MSLYEVQSTLSELARMRADKAESIDVSDAEADDFFSQFENGLPN
tara:strand:- start:453 stop:587 length:135 start_codon:yes stop_codon:yes gene_type:complete